MPRGASTVSYRAGLPTSSPGWYGVSCRSSGEPEQRADRRGGAGRRIGWHVTTGGGRSGGERDGGHRVSCRRGAALWAAGGAGAEVVATSRAKSQSVTDASPARFVSSVQNHSRRRQRQHYG